MKESCLVGAASIIVVTVSLSGSSRAEPSGSAGAKSASPRFTVADCEKGPLEVPVQVKNLQIQCKTILSRIEAAEADEARGTLGKGAVPFTRVSISSFYGDLLSAREPSSTIRNHVSLKNLTAMYSQIEARQSLFETTYLSCEFGLKDPETGALTHLDVSWTKGAYEERRAKAMHKAARCWIKGGRTQYAY